MAQYGEITVQFSSPIYYVFENGGSMTIDVVLSAASTNTVTVKYETAAGTATAGADYTTTSGTLKFDPGETSKTFAVPILPDNIVEDTEWFTVTLKEADKATVSPTQGTATVTITDYNPPPVTLEFSDWFYSGKEGTTAAIKVSLSDACSQDVKFQCVVSDGTATSGSDYLQAGTLDLTIPAGLTNASFPIALLTDATVEYDESVNFELKLTSSSPSNVSLGVISQSILFIQDFFEIPTVTFVPTPIYVLKGHTINVMATVFPATSAADVTYEVVPYDIDGDGNPDTVATVSPGAPDPVTGDTVLAVHGDLAGISVVRALYQSLEIGSAPLYVVSVEFSPSPVQVPLGADARVTAIVVPEAALPLIVFDMEDPAIASYSGAPPDFVVTGQSVGKTNFRAFLDTTQATSTAVEVQKQTVNLKLDGPFVLVSPSTVAAADRPSLKLTVELMGNPGDKADVTLKSAGTGGVEFEKNPLKDVTVGTPQTILVFGTAASTARDSTKIEARIDPMAATPDAVATLTVIEGVKLFFAGNFECRLATARNKYDEKRGFLPYFKPDGTVEPGGWTFALPGEPDFDRIIRFSGPKVIRSQIPSFVPTKIKKLVAIKPSGLEFTSGDSVIGKSIELGSDNYFYGQDGKDFADGQEPIANFKIIVGTNLLWGSETQDLPNKKAAAPTLFPLGGIALLKAGHVPPVIADADSFIETRRKDLKKELDDLTAVGQGNTQKAKNLAFRIRVLGYYPGFMKFSNKWVGGGIKVDKTIEVNPGDSQTLKLMSIRLGGPGTGFFVVEPQFYGYDGDALWGRVIGDIIIDKP